MDAEVRETAKEARYRASLDRPGWIFVEDERRVPRPVESQVAAEDYQTVAEPACRVEEPKRPDLWVEDPIAWRHHLDDAVFDEGEDWPELG